MAGALLQSLKRRSLFGIKRVPIVHYAKLCTLDQRKLTRIGWSEDFTLDDKAALVAVCLASAPGLCHAGGLDVALGTYRCDPVSVVSTVIGKNLGMVGDSKDLEPFWVEIKRSTTHGPYCGPGWSSAGFDLVPCHAPYTATIIKDHISVDMYGFDTYSYKGALDWKYFDLFRVILCCRGSFST